MKTVLIAGLKFIYGCMKSMIDEEVKCINYIVVSRICAQCRRMHKASCSGLIEHKECELCNKQ